MNPMHESTTDLVVIGGGPAGLAAALAAAEAGAGDIVLLDRQEVLGGILPQCIHNGFGLNYFHEELTGPEYAQRFIDQLPAHSQITVKLASMAIGLEVIAPEEKRIAVAGPDGYVEYHAKAVILAMGCRERPRGAISIPGSRPAGIFTAGTVQRLMNIEGFRPGNQAVVLGSGDIGLIMARRLTLEGIKVLAVVEILPYSSGLNRNLVQCLEDFMIPLLLNHTVAEIYGEKRVEGVRIAPVDESRQPVLEKSFTMDCDTLVISVGLIPENELSRMAGITLDPATSGPVVGPDYQTSVPGVFACGNVAHVHDLVDDVSIESQIAGQSAADFIRKRPGSLQTIPIQPGRNIRSVIPQSVAADRPTTLYVRPLFPEKNVRFRAGTDSLNLKAVTPGETIRYTFHPQLEIAGGVPLSLEPGSGNHDG